MSLNARNCSLMLSAVLLLVASAREAAAQTVVISRYYPLTVSSYYPAPTVSYYYAPTVTYYSPRVAYYPAPMVSYYPAPVVSYYPGAAITTRYGPWGRPRVITYSYPAYVYP